MKLLIRYIFVGALSLFPLILVLVIVNWLKELGINAYFKLNNFTDSTVITLLLMVAIFMIFALLGYSIERYGKSYFISQLDKIFENIPAIRTIYSVAKKISNMFSGNDKENRKEVVLVEYPKADVWVMAYVLNRYDGCSVIFIPTSPNPTSGYTAIVKDKMILSTTLTLEEASSFIISMGSDFVKREEITKLIQERRD